MCNYINILVNKKYLSGKRCLAQSRRTEYERMVQCLATLRRRLDENLELRLDLFLADVVGQLLRADGAIDGLFLAHDRCRDQPLVRQLVGGIHCGRTAPCNARRIRSSVVPPEPLRGLSICVTSAGL